MAIGQSTAIDTSCFCGKVKLKPSKKGYIIVEWMPVYPGENDSFKNFLKANVKLNSNDNGKVLTSFIINCEGNTCGYKVRTIEGIISKDSEIEIYNTLLKMGKWKPGKQVNENVDVPFNFLIEIKSGKII